MRDRVAKRGGRLAGLPDLVSAFALWLVLVLPAAASIVPDLYSASVPVPDQSASARSSALSSALASVLVKVTGESGAADDDVFSDMLAHPQRYLQQYRYEQRQEPLPSGSGEQTVVYLDAHFDKQALDRALGDLSQPIWGRERPETLIWLAVQDGEQRAIVSSDSDAAALASARKAADARGLPVVLPLMDLEDQNQIGFADIWGTFDDRIQAASARYQSNAILVGRLSATDDNWTARWQLLDQGQTTSWQGGPGTLDTVVASGLDHVADLYASAYALQAGSDFSDVTLVTVDGVDTLEAYARVSKYLSGLTPVTGVELLAVDSDSVRFLVHSRGTADSLGQAIALGGMLQAEPASLAQSPDANLPAAGTAAAADQGLKFHYQP